MSMVTSAMDAIIAPLFCISSQVRPVPVSRESLDSLLSADMVAKDSTMIVVEEFLPELNWVFLH